MLPQKNLKLLGFFLLASALLLLFLELGLRAGFYFAAQVRSPISDKFKHDYQIPDPRHPFNWILRPDYRVTFGEVISGIELDLAARSRKSRAYDRDFLRRQREKITRLKSLMDRRGLSPDTLYYQINRFGFKGPQTAKKPKNRTFRLMTLGDSCTYGGYDPDCYPRVLERELQKSGLTVEVINAGVEGYTPRNILARLPYLLSFKPRIVTVYAGWNDLWDRPLSWEDQIVVFSTVKNFLKNLTARRQGEIRVPEEPETGNHFPLSQLSELRTIIRQARKAGAMPVLCTLPGRYIALTDSRAAFFSPKPGEFSEASFAERTRFVNREYRQLASEEKIPLIDLESWSIQTLSPRGDYFLDEVHLNSRGTQKLGMYLASQLIPLIRESESQDEK